MVFRKGQVFKVKSPELILKEFKNAVIDSQGILIKESSRYMNKMMLGRENVTVVKPIFSDCFKGDDGWFWETWMLDLEHPFKQLTMNTE